MSWAEMLVFRTLVGVMILLAFLVVASIVYYAFLAWGAWAYLIFPGLLIAWFIGYVLIRE